MEMDLRPGGGVAANEEEEEEEDEAGGSGVMVQLWSGRSPQWKPGCGEFNFLFVFLLHQQLLTCSSAALSASLRPRAACPLHVGRTRWMWSPVSAADF